MKTSTSFAILAILASAGTTFGAPVSPRSGSGHQAAHRRNLHKVRQDIGLLRTQDVPVVGNQDGGATPAQAINTDDCEPCNDTQDRVQNGLGNGINLNAAIGAVIGNNGNDDSDGGPGPAGALNVLNPVTNNLGGGSPLGNPLDTSSNDDKTGIVQASNNGGTANILPFSGPSSTIADVKLGQDPNDPDVKVNLPSSLGDPVNWTVGKGPADQNGPIVDQVGNIIMPSGGGGPSLPPTINNLGPVGNGPIGDIANGNHNLNDLFNGIPVMDLAKNKKPGFNQVTDPLINGKPQDLVNGGTAGDAQDGIANIGKPVVNAAKQPVSNVADAATDGNQPGNTIQDIANGGDPGQTVNDKVVDPATGGNNPVDINNTGDKAGNAINGMAPIFTDSQSKEVQIDTNDTVDIKNQDQNQSSAPPPDAAQNDNPPQNQDQQTAGAASAPPPDSPPPANNDQPQDQQGQQGQQQNPPSDANSQSSQTPPPASNDQPPAQDQNSQPPSSPPPSSNDQQPPANDNDNQPPANGNQGQTDSNNNQQQAPPPSQQQDSNPPPSDSDSQPQAQSASAPSPSGNENNSDRAQPADNGPCESCKQDNDANILDIKVGSGMMDGQGQSDGDNGDNFLGSPLGLLGLINTKNASPGSGSPIQATAGPNKCAQMPFGDKPDYLLPCNGLIGQGAGDLIDLCIAVDLLDSRPQNTWVCPDDLQHDIKLWADTEKDSLNSKLSRDVGQYVKLCMQAGAL